MHKSSITENYINLLKDCLSMIFTCILSSILRYFEFKVRVFNQKGNGNQGKYY